MVVVELDVVVVDLELEVVGCETGYPDCVELELDDVVELDVFVELELDVGCETGYPD